MIKLRLERTKICREGAFGVLVDEFRDVVAYTLEHAYAVTSFGMDHLGSPDLYLPKLPDGTYLCKRGIHKLTHSTIETFEVTNVPGHSGILFHTGNSEQDSDGCILLGQTAYEDRLYNSKTAFATFMRLLNTETEFTLEVA